MIYSQTNVSALHKTHSLQCHPFSFIAHYWRLSLLSFPCLICIFRCKCIFRDSIFRNRIFWKWSVFLSNQFKKKTLKESQTDTPNDQKSLVEWMWFQNLDQELLSYIDETFGHWWIVGRNSPNCAKIDGYERQQIASISAGWYFWVPSPQEKERKVLSVSVWRFNFL